MELGSAEHKQLLLSSIRKTALKTVSAGLFIGTLMILPSLLIANTFSLGIAYAGGAIILGAVSMASLTYWKKYQKIIKPFDKTFS